MDFTSSIIYASEREYGIGRSLTVSPANKGA